MKKGTTFIFFSVIYLSIVNSFFIQTPALYANTFDIFSKKCRKELALANYDKALLFCDKAITKYPYNPEIFVTRGRVRYYLNDNYGAISDYSKAIEMNPRLGYVYWNRSISYERIGDMERACFDLKEGSRLKHKKSQERISSFC